MYFECMFLDLHQEIMQKFNDIYAQEFSAMGIQPPTTQRLRQSPLFSGLTEQEFDKVIHNAQPIDLRTGETLFSHGQPAEHFYWLSHGLIKLGRTSPGGEEKIIEIIMPGHSFAEAIMFMGSGAQYPVSAHALETCRVIQIENKSFTALLRDSTESCFRMMANMSQRLHQQLNEIERLTLQNAAERVVHYLLQQVITNPDNPSIELRIAKNLLASQLAMKPETLSRIFAQLSKDQIIEVQGTHIEIKDIRALQERRP